MRFLNVDLEIHHDANLQPLASAWGDSVVTLYCEMTATGAIATFEAPDEKADANELIRYFCGLVEALSGKPQTLWHTARSKVFDIGYAIDDNRDRTGCELSPQTLQAAAQIGAAIRFTVSVGI